MNTTKTSVYVLFLTTFAAGLFSQAGLARESDAAIGDVTFDDAQAILELQKNEMHPRVTLDLGDGEQYNFILDTGAAVNVIDATIAERLGYRVVGEIEIGAPGGPQIPGKIVSVPVAKIGGVTVTDAEFVTMDMLGFGRGETHGVLGVRLFSDYLLQFDRGAGQVVLSRDELATDAPEVVAYDATNSQFEILISVAGEDVAAHIDTGSMGEFTLPGEMISTLPVRDSGSNMKARLVGGERDIEFAELQGNIVFAGLTFENPNVAFMTPSSRLGNIGSAILSDYVVTIDQKNHLIAFQQPADGGAAVAAAKPRRIGVQFRGMPDGKELTIAAVGAGSLAEQAGLRVDDVMIALNGKARV